MTSSVDHLAGPTEAATPNSPPDADHDQWRGPALGYGLTLLFVFLATGSGFLVQALSGRFVSFPFYAAVVASAWFGRGPGLLSVVLSILIVEDVWTPPLFSLWIAPEEIPAFGAFVICTFMSFAWSAHRRKTQHLLETAVAQRTAALRETNQALQIEIADRQAAEEELRRSEALLAQGEKLSRTASWILRLPGGEMSWSAELFTILEIDAAGVVPSYDLLIERMYPDDRIRFEAEMQRALLARGDFSCDARIVVAGGAIRQVQAVGEVTPSGAMIECIGTIIDVTERRATEQALQELQTELARTMRLATLAEVAGTIAHEINQPLAAITANGGACLRSLTRDPPLLDNARDAAECIVADGHRAADVITRIRALFEKKEPQRLVVNVNALLDEVVELCRASIDRQAVTVRPQLDLELPSLMADPVQLRQVIVNLVTNAVEAMEGVAKPRRLTLRTTAEPADAVTIIVEDTGIGLPPGPAGRIFDSFYTTKAHGLGLGLAISLSIVEAHGGKLRAEPNQPHGARFILVLPSASGSADPIL